MKNEQFKLITRFNKKQSTRQHKMSKLMQIAINECLDQGKYMLDPRLIQGEFKPLNITDVSITADLRIVNCYFLPFNTDLKEKEILDALNKSKFAIKNYIKQKVRTKYLPDIRFFYDHASAANHNIDDLLRKIVKQPS